MKRKLNCRRHHHHHIIPTARSALCQQRRMQCSSVCGPVMETERITQKTPADSGSV